MEKLLAWSIANESGDKEAMEKIGKPDEKALAQLFGTGGPDEPTLMKQSIQVVENPEADLEAKEVALENFEMLIENLDNANNIENMKMWPSIIKLLNDDQPEPLRILATSIIAIAVQNNPKCQDDFLKHSEGVSKLIAYGADSNTKLVLKYKLLFAVSSLIRNHPDSFKFFSKLDGWKLLSLSKEEKDDKLIMRTLSLISSILTNEKLFKFEIEPKIHSLHLINELVGKTSGDNINVIEKFLQIIVHLIDLNYKFDEEEISQISGFLSSSSQFKSDYPAEFSKIESTLLK